MMNTQNIARTTMEQAQIAFVETLDPASLFANEQLTKQRGQVWSA